MRQASRWINLLLAFSATGALAQPPAPAANGWGRFSISDQRAADLPDMPDREFATGSRDADWLAGPAAGTVAGEPTGWEGPRGLPMLAPLRQPLRHTSWLNRPAYMGVFIGTWLADSLDSGSVDQTDSFQGGYWLGYDWNPHFGTELGFSYFYSDIVFVPENRLGGSSRNLLFEGDLLYYPWGDTRLRPYLALGLGIGGVHYLDRSGQGVNHTGVAFPMGLGVKYLWHRKTALRMDVRHHLMTGGGQVDTMSNWSISWGIEWHWGGDSSMRYYPW